jgi:hypothetical protein
MIVLVFVIAASVPYAYGPYPFATEAECVTAAAEVLKDWSERDVHGRITCSHEFMILHEWKR